MREAISLTPLPTTGITEPNFDAARRAVLKALDRASRKRLPLFAPSSNAS